MRTKLLIAALVLAIPIVSAASYVLGSIHAERRSSKFWKTHFIPMELNAARRIRNGELEKAIAILERNSLFYERSFDISSTSIFPNRWELDAFFNPEPYQRGPLEALVARARNIAAEYVTAYPESLQQLER
jgi:hypothetical protein